MTEVNYLAGLLNMAQKIGLYVDGVASNTFVIRASARGKRTTGRLDVHAAIEWLDSGIPNVPN